SSDLSANGSPFVGTVSSVSSPTLEPQADWRSSPSAWNGTLHGEEARPLHRTDARLEGSAAGQQRPPPAAFTADSLLGDVLDAARPGAGLGQAVIGAQQRAGLERETSAVDAAGQLVFEAIDVALAPFDLQLPAPRGVLPLVVRGGAVHRDRREGRLYVAHGDAQSFGDRDQGDPSQHVARVASLVAGGPHRGDELQVLVVAQGRDGHSGAPAHLADGEQRIRLAGGVRGRSLLVTSSALEILRCRGRATRRVDSSGQKGRFRKGGSA